jgi:hypothetical protein
MYDKKRILDGGTVINIEESKVEIPIAKLDEFVRIAERVEAIKRMYYENKGILCTSDVVAILCIEKFEEENEDA